MPTELPEKWPGRERVGWYLTQWIAPVPKKVGTIRVTEQRPLCMLEVLRNICLGDLFRQMQEVWAEHGAIASKVVAVDRVGRVDPAVAVGGEQRR